MMDMRSLFAVYLVFITKVCLDGSETVKWNTDDGETIPTVEITFEGEIMEIPLREAPFCRLWETHQCLCFMLRESDNSHNWSSASFSYCDDGDIRGSFLNSTEFFEVKTVQIGSSREYNVTKYPPGENYTEVIIDHIDDGYDNSSDNGSLYYTPFADEELMDYETGFIPCFFVIDPVILKDQPNGTIDFYLQEMINGANKLLGEFNILAYYRGYSKARDKDLLIGTIKQADDFIMKGHQYYHNENISTVVILFSPICIRDKYGCVDGRSKTDSICNASVGAFVRYRNRTEKFSMRMVGQTLAHELGHTLGLWHSELTDCKDPPKGKIYVMSETTNNLAGDVIWSDCSKDQIKKIRPAYYCLRKKIKPLRPSCKNGILEDGEQCECVSEACRKCCNNECQLTRGSKCSSGPCCNKETCKPRRKDEKYTCRKARDLCDIPEMCSGRTHKCPLNYVVADGADCKQWHNEERYCYNGKCPGRRDVCLWRSPPAYGLDLDLCYDLNTNDSRVGCGPTFTDHKDIPNFLCEEKDKLCGKLFCLVLTDWSNEYKRAHYQQRIDISWLWEVKDGKKTPCFYFVLGSNTQGLQEDLTFVQNGSICGTEDDPKMCVKQKCVPLPPGCPKNCSGKRIAHPETGRLYPSYILPDPDAELEDDVETQPDLNFFQWLLIVFSICCILFAIVLVYRNGMSRRHSEKSSESVSFKSSPSREQVDSRDLSGSPKNLRVEFRNTRHKSPRKKTRPHKKVKG